MRILIADDHALVRAGLAMMLVRFFPACEICEAEDLASTMTRAQQAAPDVVLLDLEMPGMEQFDGLSRLLERWPELRVIMLSAHAGREEVRTAMALGARGYIPKASGAAVVRHALEMVLAGEMFVPASAFRGDPDVAQDANTMSLTASLTTRQRETLALVIEGLSNKEIARRMGVIESTVKTHLKVIMRKLGARNRTHAARIATESGMVAEGASARLEELH